MYPPPTSSAPSSLAFEQLPTPTTATRPARERRGSASRPNSRPNDRKGRSRRPFRRLLPLRIGCVNVQALPNHNWAAVASLIDDDAFDYLFVLETSCMDHSTRPGDRRVIATTELPSSPLTAGHHPGGIVLLGAARARGWLRGDARVCGQEAVTISTTQGRFTWGLPSATPSPSKSRLRLTPWRTRTSSWATSTLDSTDRSRNAALQDPRPDWNSFVSGWMRTRSVTSCLRATRRLLRAHRARRCSTSTTASFATACGPTLYSSPARSNSA